MRKLHTIEVDKWVPGERKGMVKHAGMISPQEAFDALEKHLKEADLMPDEYFNSNTWCWKDVKELPDYIRASCDVNWGGSEGIYLDVSLLYRDEKQQLQRFNLATGKTLGQTGDDFLRMSRIAAECSMMLNGRGDLVRFYEEPVKEGVEVELNNQMTVRISQKDKDIVAEFVDTDGEVLKKASIDEQALFEFLRNELYKDEKEYENIQLTAREKSLVVKALDFYGDKVADTKGYSEGEEYWNLKAKFESIENNLSQKEVFNWDYIKSLPVQASELVATYEEVFLVPSIDRVTEWFGDYGLDVFKTSFQGITPAQIQAMYDKALDAIGMSSEEFLANKNQFASRAVMAELMNHKKFAPLQDQIGAAKGELKDDKSNKNIVNKER